MLWIVIGLALWSGAHLFKRLAPARRAGMKDGAAKGLVAVTSFAGIAAMVIGYRSADYVGLYTPPAFGLALTVLASVVAVALMGLGSSKSRLRGKLRHPMLTGVTLWGVAHLFARGDLASVLLFGGLAVWAHVQMRLINKAEPKPAPFTGGTQAGDIRLAVITAVLTVVIWGAHHLLGATSMGA